MINIDAETLIKLNCQQQEIINSTENRIVVHAGPGSGKTYTLIRIIQKNLADNPDYKGIIACSFTREASNQLKEKLTFLCDPRDSFIGTIDSFIFKEIINNFKNRLLELQKINNKVKDLIFAFPEMNSRVNILTKYGINEEFKSERAAFCREWIDLLSRGIYEVSFPSYVWAAKMLNDIDEVSLYINSKYSSIYVDEAQDMNDFQHRFFEILSKKCNLKMIFIGDSKQSIYQFRGARPESFLNLKNLGFKEYRISYSARCHKSILDFCNLLITPEYVNDVHKDIRVNLNHSPSIVNLTDLSGNFLILCERNDLTKKIYTYLRENNISVILSERLSLTNKRFSDNYYELIEEIMKFYLNITNSNPKLTYSILLYRDFLSNYVSVEHKKDSELVPKNESLLQYTIRIFKILKIDLPSDVHEDLENNFNNSLVINQYTNFIDVNRIMTIHSSKGLESENVFVVLGESFGIDDEYKRKLFVAFSRAKFNLYISKTNEAKQSTQPYDQILIDNYCKLCEQ